MEEDLKNFIEKLELNKLEEDIRTKDITDKKGDIKINLSENEADVKEKALFLENDGEEIPKQDLEEDSKEDELILNTLIEDLNKNILINVKEDEEDKNQMACREILEILRYPRSHKNLRGVVSPFKPLFQPKKISMVGKVFYNSTENEDNKTRDNTNINNNISK